MQVHGIDELESAFASMVKARAGAVIIQNSFLFSGPNVRRLADLAIRHRLPAMYPFGTFTDAGGFIAYGPDLADLLRRAAPYVDKILKGAKPADLPVEQPDEVRPGDQSQDSQDAWHHGAAIGVDPGQSGDQGVPPTPDDRLTIDARVGHG